MQRWLRKTGLTWKISGPWGASPDSQSEVNDLELEVQRIGRRDRNVFFAGFSGGISACDSQGKRWGLAFALAFLANVHLNRFRTYQFRPLEGIVEFTFWGCCLKKPSRRETPCADVWCCTPPRSWGFMYAREAFRELGLEQTFFLIVEHESFWPYFESKPSISSWWPVRFSEPTSQWDGTPMGGQCSFIGTETLGGMANSSHREYRGQIPRAKWEMCGNSWLSLWGAFFFLKRC